MRKSPFLWRVEDWIHEHSEIVSWIFGLVILSGFLVTFGLAVLILSGIAWGAVQIIGWLL